MVLIQVVHSGCNNPMCNNNPSTVGTTTIVWTAMDVCGNTIPCTQTITRNGPTGGTITESNLPLFCQGCQKYLTLSGSGILTYSWSGPAGGIIGSSNTATILVGIAGTYTCTLTNSSCGGSVSYTVALPCNTNLLSGFNLLADRLVHIHRTTVNGGNIGVRNSGGTAKIHEYSTVNGDVTADNINFNGYTGYTSTVTGAQTANPANVSLPAFHGCTSTITSTYNVAANANVTLTGSNYGRIVIGNNATVTFSGQAVVNAFSFTSGTGVTIRFNQCTEMRICDFLLIGPNGRVNTANLSVTWMVGGLQSGTSSSSDANSDGHAEIKDGVIFNGNIYVADGGNLFVRGNGGGWGCSSNTTNNPTVMKGLYIAGYIYGGKYVTFNKNNNCGQCTPPPPVPPTIVCPGNKTVCFGATVNLGTPTVTAGNGGTPVVDNNAPEDFPAGVTTVTWTATDANGSVATCTQTVTVGAKINASISETGNGFCQGNVLRTLTVTASGGTGALTYTWSNGSHASTISVNNGTYSVTVTDASGCSASVSYTVGSSGGSLASHVLIGTREVLLERTKVNGGGVGVKGNYHYAKINQSSTVNGFVTADHISASSSTITGTQTSSLQ